MKIWGVLNITPDSFSDGGKYELTDLAADHAGKMLEDGADIIDIGGESTRPGAGIISADEEIKRVVPVIKAIRENFPGVVISIDTYKAKTAEAALDAGAEIVNDISAAADPDMIPLVAERKCRYCLSHNPSAVFDCSTGLIKNLNDRQKNVSIQSVSEGLSAKADELMTAGIAHENIILDPGIGFGMDTNECLSLIKHVAALKRAGFPVLLGVSRKSVIGNSLGLPVDERLEGTLALTAYAFMQGIDYVRVHDVKENYRVIKMLEAVMAEHTLV